MEQGVAVFSAEARRGGFLEVEALEEGYQGRIHFYNCLSLSSVPYA